jgi:hypothetical protein
MYNFDNFEVSEPEHDIVHAEGGQTENEKKTKKNGILGEINSLLNTNATSIITISISIAIGTSFNTAIMSFISDIIHPIFIKLLLFSGLHHMFYNIEQIVNLQQQSINVGLFISSVLSFMLLCLLCYQINENLMKYI